MALAFQQCRWNIPTFGSSSASFEEQAATQLTAQQITAGRVTRRANKKFMTIQRRLADLKTRFDQGKIAQMIT
jgi:hypothetical protein